MRCMLPVLSLLMLLPSILTTQGRQPESKDAPPKPNVVERLNSEAGALKPLARSGTARAFLDAAARLPLPGARVVWRSKDRTRALTPAQYEKLPAAERDAFARRECDPTFYYYTGYGTPLAYARPLDLLAQSDPGRWSEQSIPGKRIADFGYGTIGHLRILASLGADVTGIEVEPLFTALYAGPGDQGEVARADAPGGRKGRLRLLEGHWPADAGVAGALRERGPYDLFISKNTLKRGYIHPARETDPSRLVHLGVDDAAFVNAVYASLAPGGVFLIYNICPAQSPPDKPYLPHADGESPFTRETLEKAGFEIMKFDEEDRDQIVKYWMVLGYNEGKSEEETKADLFAWWTMCRKPSSAAAP